MTFLRGRLTLLQALWLILLAVTLLLTACERGTVPTKPAPIGDQAALQQLADAYEEVAEDLPMSPQRLAPGERKQFVHALFARAGYGYEASLCEMAKAKWDPADRTALDLAELLMLPHANATSMETLQGLYTPQESACLRALQGRMPH
jgi:hypothetical protein